MIKTLKNLVKRKEFTFENVRPVQMTIKKMPRSGLEDEQLLECLKDILRLQKKTNKWHWFTAMDLAKISKYTPAEDINKKEQFLKSDLDELFKDSFLLCQDGQYKLDTKFLEVFRRNISVPKKKTK